MLGAPGSDKRSYLLAMSIGGVRGNDADAGSSAAGFSA